MPDLGLSVTVSRAALGLGPLQLNDHLNYYVAAQLLGGNVTWNRSQTSSPFVDGSFTSYRTRPSVTEQMAVEVLGADPGEVRANVEALVAAVCQDTFTLTVTADGDSYVYRCEAADYQLVWAGPRMVARQAQVVLSIPRQPVPVAGVV